jgi:hypothetical protein
MVDRYSYGRRLPGLQLPALPGLAPGRTGFLNLPALGRRQPLYFGLRLVQGLVFLLNSRQSLFSATPSGYDREGLDPTGVPLLPKLRGDFAEFLEEDSLARLMPLRHHPPVSVCGTVTEAG